MWVWGSVSAKMQEQTPVEGPCPPGQKPGKEASLKQQRSQLGLLSKQPKNPEGQEIDHRIEPEGSCRRESKLSRDGLTLNLHH